MSAHSPSVYLSGLSTPPTFLMPLQTSDAAAVSGFVTGCAAVASLLSAPCSCAGGGVGFVSEDSTLVAGGGSLFCVCVGGGGTGLDPCCCTDDWTSFSAVPDDVTAGAAGGW